MSDLAALTPERARIARIVAGFFLLVAMVSLAGAVVASIYPGLKFGCGSTGCFRQTNPISLAPEDVRPNLSASADARTAFANHLNRSDVRLGLASTYLIGALPFVLLMTSVGLALRKLAARRGNDLGEAVPWLRRGALAALVMAPAKPVAESLRAMTLYPGTPAGPMWSFEIDFVGLALNLLLASAAVAVVWALDAGGRAEREAASFV